MSTTPINDWGQAFMTSMTSALMMFLGAIPRIVAFAAILIVGWIIAGLLAGAVASLLRAVRFNDLAERAGIAGFVRNMGVRTDASGALATVVNWFVRLIVLVVAFDALGLPAVSQVLQQFLMWLPNLVVALVVLVIGGLAANALHGLVRGATAQAGLGNPDLLATIARIAVWAFTIVIAVNQIGIASTLVNTLFMGVVAALALGFGLAFGLGGRDTAAQVVRDWYTSARQSQPALARAAAAAGDRMDVGMSQARAEVDDATPPRRADVADYPPADDPAYPPARGADPVDNYPPAQPRGRVVG